jgi:hypothetical protein
MEVGKEAGSLGIISMRALGPPVEEPIIKRWSWDVTGFVFDLLAPRDPNASDRHGAGITIYYLLKSGEK